MFGLCISCFALMLLCLVNHVYFGNRGIVMEIMPIWGVICTPTGYGCFNGSFCEHQSREITPIPQLSMAVEIGFPRRVPDSSFCFFSVGLGRRGCPAVYSKVNALFYAHPRLIL